MDIFKVLQQLHAEKKRLDQAIAALERSGAGQSPRGRVWNAQARTAARERMKQYWSKRRSVDGRPPSDIS
jgi:hypothetical protein